MENKIFKISSTIILTVACALLNVVTVFGNIEGKTNQDPYEQMTVLDISKGAIQIDQDHINGFDQSGNPIHTTNNNGYHIMSSEGSTWNKITVEKGVHTKIVVDNVHILKSDTDKTNPSPLFIRPGASVTLILEGDNSFEGSDYNAGIGVPQAGDGTMAELTIEGNGSVKATSGKRGAGIGGGQKCGYTGGAGIITINSGHLTLIGGDYGGGVGNSENTGDIQNCKITINGGTIYAESKNQSNGIGGGRDRQPAKADITINGGVIYATGPKYAIRGSSLKINGGNIIACGQNSQTDRWQTFSPNPQNEQGQSVSMASIQLDDIDAGKALTVTCDNRTYNTFSDDEARVNVILMADEKEIVVHSETGNEYKLNYDTLLDKKEITEKPYRYPLLRVEPDEKQTFVYGNKALPTYKTYDSDGTQIEDTASIFTGNLAIESITDDDWLPYHVKVRSGSLRIKDHTHCFTVKNNVMAQIVKRPIQVSAQDLKVFDGQYTHANLPFSFQLANGSLVAGDTLADAFTFEAEVPSGSSKFTEGVYKNVQFAFYSRHYQVTVKGQGPTLEVLKNDSLLKQGETLTFGTDENGKPVSWDVADVMENQTLLYSHNVFDNLTYDQASRYRENAPEYMIMKIPDLTNYIPYIRDGAILDQRIADIVSHVGGIKCTSAMDINGIPSKYWMFQKAQDASYIEAPIYIDEEGNTQQATDNAAKASVRFVLAINLRSHTVPLITLSNQITSNIHYGDIKAGTKIAQVTDGANLKGHKLTSYRLLKKSSDADNFTLSKDGVITAKKMLDAKDYTLYIQSEDELGYKAESSVTFTIRKKELEIIPQTGIYMYEGDALPPIPYTYDKKDLLPGDSLVGSLNVDMTDAKEDGQYPITLGTLYAGDNYHLVLTNHVNITVRKKPSVENPTDNADKASDDKSDPTINTQSTKIDTGDTKNVNMLVLCIVLSGIMGGVIYKKRN